MATSIYKLSAEELAPDILELLHLHRQNKIHEAVVRQVLKGACWWISNAQGRKDSCDLWSKDSIELRKRHSSWEGLGLIHEHIVPRNVIEEEILKLEEPTKASIIELLMLSRVCVVTPKEDVRLRTQGHGSKLPTASSLSEGGMRRYVVAGIELSEVPYRSDA